ncbi:MAG TPA: hypothetical protein VKR38_08455 [Usitatibacter sp.]|nr:hypothetical protein [Usitatibacter sp.]
MAATLRGCVWTLALAASVQAFAKPIAFQDGWTTMAEYGTNTMRQAQVFYAPKYWWSGGLSLTEIIADDRSFEHDISSVQLNYLVKRWNLPEAQGNVFAWGGLGSTRGHDGEGQFTGLATVQAGVQVDYETRRIYASGKQEWFHSSRFTNGISTVQLGVAPYEHDYDEIATWFLVQLRHYQGGVLPGTTEVIPMLRLFKGNFWIEAGADHKGRAQLMVMMNF